MGMGLQDATAYWEERNKRNEAERYQLSLERATTGEGYLASMVGREKAKDAFSSGLTALAGGGLARTRRPYLVGEKGPELMVPDQDGTVIPNHKLQVLARALKKRAVARARGGSVQAGGAPPEEDRAFGFRNTGGIKAAAGIGADLAAAGAALGAPTSYAGGAGAPDSIGVIRGMKQTYAQDTGGPQLQEFATPQQAGQAWNRNQSNQDLAMAQRTPGVTPNVRALTEKHGEYVPAGGELEKIKGGYLVKAHEASAMREPPGEKALREKQLAELTKTTNITEFNKQWDSYHAKYDRSSGAIVKPTDPAVLADKRMAEEVARMEGPKAGLDNYQESLKFREHEKTMTPEERAEGQKNPIYWRRFVLEDLKKQRKMTIPPPPQASRPASREIRSGASGLSRPPSLQELGQRMVEPFM